VRRLRGRTIHLAAHRGSGGDGDLLFLRNFWATIIPAITVPLSLIGTFAVLYEFGYSLDNLSLMALSIASRFCG